MSNAVLTNRQIVEKADFALSELTSAGGVMSPAQAREFVRRLIDSPTVLRRARPVMMAAPKQEINKVRFASRILRPAGTTAEVANIPSRYLASSDRSKPETSKVELSTVEVMAEIRIIDEALEDNIEGASFQDTIVQEIAKRAALDMEELGVNGDTATVGDAYLALLDGYIKQAASQQVDVLNAPLDKTVFRDAIKTLPNPYLRDRARLMFWISYDQDANLRHSLADRATTGGDSFLLSDTNIRQFGVQIEPVAVLADTKGIFTNPDNCIFGIWRRVRIETERSARSREWIVVLTARVDFKYEESLAAVRMINVGT